MKRTSATRCLGGLLVAAVAFAQSGCSREYWHQIRGAIRDADTGEPVVGAKVEFRHVGGYSVAGPLVTDDRGEFELRFERSDPTMYWRLVLKAAGYAEEWIKVGDVQTHRENQETVHLVFHVTMRQIAR